LQKAGLDMKLNYSGKDALILGGSCETALCLAKLMMESQLFPVLSYRNHPGKKRIHSFLSPDFSGQFRTTHLDLSNPDTINRFANEPLQDLDYVIDFIQDNYESLIPGASKDCVQHNFTCNIINRSLLLQHISRAMLARRKGRLIYISSTAAAQQNPGQGFYAACKQASEAIYRNIGIEMGAKGITTVSLRAGYIHSGRGKHYLNKRPDMKKYALEIKHVAETILYLLSDSGTGFNATELVLDKGMLAAKT